jgi:exodeoxyribonuclease-3
MESKLATPAEGKAAAATTTPPAASGRAFVVVSWTVNGLRGLEKRVGKPLAAVFRSWNADCVCLQETKLSSFDDVTDDIAMVEGFDSYFSFSRDEKHPKGWSGTVTYCRKGLAKGAAEGFGSSAFNREGRVVQLDFGRFVLFNVYFPNAKRGDDRLAYKMAFYSSFKAKCDELVAQGTRDACLL